MNAQQTEPTHELTVKVTEREINLWRLANCQLTMDGKVRVAFKLFIKSLRKRIAMVRQLGKNFYNAAV